MIIPQLRIEIDGNQLEQFGLTRDNINEFVETAMNGVVVFPSIGRTTPRSTCW